MDHSEQAASIFNKWARLYQDKFMVTSLYHDSFDIFCRALKPIPAVLEIACGPGNISQYLLKHRPDIELLGIDLAPDMLELAKQNNSTAAFRLMDAREIKELSTKFDGIMVGFGLPYLNKTETLQLIENAATMLQPNGVIYMSTMEGEYAESKLTKGSSGDEIFIHYHEAKYLTDALLQHGLNLMHTERIKNIMGANIPTTDLILIAQRS